ncbi:major capsid protein [Clostridium scatologenes]|uniref:Phage protein n=1 Tax=Clostridium scatologenes TaxID=1548 RepID=A0A0E3K1N4_CLOSL|nr:major capsid protein [Clostridium scatologenes]AKA70139.1 phage protein [Clostridium scatologenes]
MNININDVLNPESISEYITNTPQAVTIGQELFPNKKQLGLDITLIKGAKNKPIVLSQSAFDVAVKVRSLKANITEDTKEMPFFKESILINERDRQELLKAMSSVNSTWRDLVLDKIYTDINSLVVGAGVQIERMRMQLLSEGKIFVTSDENEISFDYGLPTNHKEVLSGTAKWSDFVNSTPIDDIIRYQDKVEEDTGVRPSRAVCTRKTFNYLKNNKSIKLDINSLGTTIITDSILKQYLQDKVGVTVAIVSGKFIAEDKSEQQYFPDNVFTLIPSGALGNTYFGTTPEEADLMTNSDAKVQIVNTGVAVTTMVSKDPVNVQTKVSQICLPSFEHVEEIFVTTVA